MAELGETFNPDEVEPRDDFGPIPVGTHTLEIRESGVEDFRNGGSGKRAMFTFEITEGDLVGRRHWENINYRNDNNPQNQKIGQQQLAELCAACGHRGPLDDTELLHGIPFKARFVLSFKTESDGAGGKRKVADIDSFGNHRTKIARYLPYDAASAPARSAPAARAERPRELPGANVPKAAPAAGGGKFSQMIANRKASTASA